MAKPVKSFSVVCDSGLAADVKAVVRAELRRERAWWNDALADVVAIRDPQARADARAQLEAEREHRRRTGAYLATMDRLMVHHLQAVLKEKGWDGEYKRVPPGAASVAGKRTGVPLKVPERTGDRKGRLFCHVPFELWDQVRRVAYWVSEPYVRELRQWHARFGDGPGAAAREGGMAELSYIIRAASGRGPKETDMRRREELRGLIVTTGDIVRLAARNATKTLQPPTS